MPTEGERDVERIQRIIDLMTAAGAVELEMRDGEQRVRIRLREDRAVVSYAAPPPAFGAPTFAAPAPQKSDAGETAAAENRDVFKSPMVGTFYRQSSPDADPFVKVGDRVTPDRTLCIIEAMKVMNEIKAEIEGEIVETLAQNGQPVEFGQPLFVIKRV